MLAGLINSQTGVCPAGMVEVGAGVTFTCVDQYEVSASDACTHLDPQSAQDSEVNLAIDNCQAVSQSKASPWRNVTRTQAALACAEVSKRLPTAEEWHRFVLGTPDSASECNVSKGTFSKTGAQENCISSSGIYDGVGNVWEWVSDDIFDGQYNGRKLPASGYVSQVDSGGVATVVDVNPQESHKEDYFWSEAEGVYAMMRGGFYGSKDDAGVFTAHAATLPDFSGAAIGFRCVK